MNTIVFPEMRRVVLKDCMKKCYIISAADIEGAAPEPREGDLVIAADAGYLNALKLGLVPDITAGDFDSLESIPGNCGRMIRHPVRKDDTDTSLAVKEGLRAGYGTFVILGGTGGKRADHTIANIQTLIMIAKSGARGYLFGNNCAYTAVNNSKIRFDSSNSGIVSVFCFGESAKGVTERGLEYSLENGTLDCSFPIGVSNSFKGKEALISVEDGTLVIYFETGYERFIKTVELNEEDK